MVANLSLFQAPVSPPEVQNDLNILVNAFNAGGITTAQTNQTLGIIGVSNTVGQSASSTFDARSLSIEGAGNVSVGMSNGSLIISGQNPTIFSAGNNVTAFASKQILFQGGNNITLSQSLNAGSATITISGPNQPFFSNSNGISFGTNGNNITASYTVPTVPAQTNQTIGLYGAGNTTGTSSGTIDARSLSINAVGAISAGFSNGSLELSVGQGAQSNQTLGLYAVSNTTQSTSGTANATNLSFEGAGGVSIGISNGSVLISGAAAGGGPSAAAGTQTASSGTVLFSNSNGISFGMSNSSVITASYTVPTQSAQTQSNIQALYDGANSISTGTVRLTNANGVSFSLNGQTLSASVAAQSAQTQSNIQAIFDGANSISTGTMRLTNANGISFSINGQTLSGSVAAQTNQTIGFYGLGNTTQNSSTTFDARTVSFNGLGGNTIGFSNGSINISGAGGTAGGANTWSGKQQFSGGIYQSAGSAEEAVFSNGNSGTSLALNLDNGNLQSVTITGAVAITLTAPTHPGKFTLIVTQDGTGHVYSISGVKFAGGTVPSYSTAANKIDVISLAYDGTNWYGVGNIAFA